MSLAFDISNPSRTITGADASKGLGSLLKEHSLKKILFLTDPGIKSTPIADELQELIRNEGGEILELANLARENVDEVIEVARRYEPDAVVGVGGGSVLDVAKLCSVLVRSTKTTLELLDGEAVPPHTLFTVLIPTTAGTGSEATKNAIIAIPARHTKGAVVNEKLLPDLVILDPALTLSLPRGITATTGMDALCHAVECYLSRKANVMNDLLALEAISLIASSLRKAADNGEDLESRANMLIASYYAGMCITLSGTNAVHAMSYPLGTTYHIPHGQANAMLLPFVMEHNLTALPEKTAKVAECFGYDPKQEDLDPAAYLTRELHQLVKDLDINTSLLDFGVKREDLETLVESAYGNRRLMDNNPMELDRQRIGSIYLQLMGGAQ